MPVFLGHISFPQQDYFLLLSIVSRQKKIQLNQGNLAGPILENKVNSVSDLNKEQFIMLEKHSPDEIQTQHCLVLAQDTTSDLHCVYL